MGWVNDQGNPVDPRPPKPDWNAPTTEEEITEAELALKTSSSWKVFSRNVRRPTLHHMLEQTLKSTTTNDPPVAVSSLTKNEAAEMLWSTVWLLVSRFAWRIDFS